MVGCPAGACPSSGAWLGAGGGLQRVPAPAPSLGWGQAGAQQVPCPSSGASLAGYNDLYNSYNGYDCYDDLHNGYNGYNGYNGALESSECLPQLRR